MTHQPRLSSVLCHTSIGLHRMAYTEWGDADNRRVLICVHGLSRVGRDFDDLARALAGEYRVVCPDLPGRGRSDWLADPMLYQVPTYVANMVTLIARLDPHTLHWFGTSLGGMIGMALASLEHAPIERMILNDMGPVLAGPALRRICDYLGKPIRFATIDEAVVYVSTISASFGPLTATQWRHFTEVAIRREGDAWVMHYDPALAQPFKALVGDDPAPPDLQLWDHYDRVRCPTLAVRGELSDLLSRDVHAQMACRGPKAELAEIAGVGHAPAFMSVDQIALAREFLLRDR